MLITISIKCDVRGFQCLPIHDYFSGASIGGFLYATAQNEFIELFGLDGCLLLTGSFALNIIACGGLMRPLHLPAYYLKQGAALVEKTEEKLSERPLALDHSIEKDLPVTDLLITVETKGTLASEKELLICSVLVRLLKKKQKTYIEYLRSIAEQMRDWVFVAMCLALFLYSVGAFPPLLFLEDVAQSEGLIEDISVVPLVSIYAIAGGIGKLLLGMVMDIRWINSLYFYSFTLVGSGMALLLIPFTKSYVGLQVISAVLGFLSGNWSITPYMTTKVVGIERLTEAYGILMFFSGFGIMLGPPVVGTYGHFCFAQCHYLVCLIPDVDIQDKITLLHVSHLLPNDCAHGSYCHLQAGSMIGCSPMTSPSISVGVVCCWVECNFCSLPCPAGTKPSTHLPNLKQSTLITMTVWLP